MQPLMEKKLPFSIAAEKMDSLNEEFFKTDWIHILLLQNINLLDSYGTDQ